MAGPKQKFYGSFSLDGIKKAVTEVPSKVKDNEKYGKQLYVTAAQWDDDGISIELWTKETGSIKLGNLRVSSFDNSPEGVKSNNAAFAAKDDDLPF